MAATRERKTTACRGCGKQVLFVVTVDGKTVPLDPVAPVFWRTHDPETGKAFWHLDNKNDRSAMVSHFSTCSRANDFSSSNLKREPIA